jgi:hypothetical protein
VNMSDSEIVEVEIDTNGTIYEVDELWLLMTENKLLPNIY